MSFTDWATCLNSILRNSALEQYLLRTVYASSPSVACSVSIYPGVPNKNILMTVTLTEKMLLWCFSFVVFTF